MNDVELVRAGALAIIPTDTVYGIGCAASLTDAVERLYALKERPASQPTGVMFGSLERLLAELGEIDEVTRRVLEMVLPGPVTLVIANRNGRFLAACGQDPTRIGVRVPVLTAETAALLDGAGGMVVTSANLRGRAAPAAFDQISPELIAAAAVVSDGGTLPGTASSVVDIAGPHPVVLRDGPGTGDVFAAVR